MGVWWWLVWGFMGYTLWLVAPFSSNTRYVITGLLFADPEVKIKGWELVRVVLLANIHIQYKRFYK